MKKICCLLTVILCLLAVSVPVSANIRTTQTDVEADLKTAYLLGGGGKNYAAGGDKKDADNETVTPGHTVYYAIQGAKTADGDMIGSQQIPLLTDPRYFSFAASVTQGDALVESILLTEMPRAKLETYSSRTDDAWYLAVKVKKTSVGKSDPAAVRFQVRFTATQSGAAHEKSPIGKQDCALLLKGELLLQDGGDGPLGSEDSDAEFADRSYGSSSGYAKFAVAREPGGAKGSRIIWTVDNKDDPKDGTLLTELEVSKDDSKFRPKLDAQMTRKQKTTFRNVKAVLRGFTGDCELPAGATARLTLYNPFPAQNAREVHIYEQSGDMFQDVTDRFSCVARDDNYIFTSEVLKLGTYLLSDDTIG